MDGLMEEWVVLMQVGSVMPVSCLAKLQLFYFFFCSCKVLVVHFHLVSSVGSCCHSLLVNFLNATLWVVKKSCRQIFGHLFQSLFNLDILWLGSFGARFLTALETGNTVWLDSSLQRSVGLKNNKMVLSLHI